MDGFGSVRLYTYDPHIETIRIDPEEAETEKMSAPQAKAWGILWLFSS